MFTTFTSYTVSIWEPYAMSEHSEYGECLGKYSVYCLIREYMW